MVAFALKLTRTVIKDGLVLMSACTVYSKLSAKIFKNIRGLTRWSIQRNLLIFLPTFISKFMHLFKFRIEYPILSKVGNYNNKYKLHLLKSV